MVDVIQINIVKLAAGRVDIAGDGNIDEKEWPSLTPTQGGADVISRCGLVGAGPKVADQALQSSVQWLRRRLQG